MNKDNTQELKLIKVALLVFAAVFSLVASILAFATDFGGWWWGGSTSSHYFYLGADTDYSPVWAKLFLVLLGLLFLALLVLSVILGIFILLGKGEKFVKILGFVGVGGAIFGFILSLITLGVLFGIAGDYEDLWLSAGFYGTIIGSLLVGIFFLLYSLMGSLIKPSGKTTKTNELKIVTEY